ncbi:adaptor protein [Babesia caballi]|uniref:Adaptor protein n=1 Tax=Babesia caballi TaxID=5871 RepID=A0AAV4LWB6_BABCB|nr:adaptor protein [Babesia caballi]
MISSVFISNKNGKLLLFKGYGGHTTQQDAAMFAQNMIQRSCQPYKPVQQFAFASFFRVRLDQFHLVASCHGDVNAMLVMQCLNDLRGAIVTLLEANVTEAALLGNTPVLHDMFDLAIDAGFPQDFYLHYLNYDHTREATSSLFRRGSADLSSYVGRYGVDYPKFIKSQRLTRHVDNLEDTSDPTLLKMRVEVPWRSEGITTRRSALALSVAECLSCSYSHVGELLHSEVTGSLTLECLISGRPTVSIRLNTDFTCSPTADAYTYVDNKSESAFPLPVGATAAAPMLDFKVDKTVNIRALLQTRCISLVPPHGMTTLMIYRCDIAGQLPFDIKPVLTRATKQLVYYHVTIQTRYHKKVVAHNLLLRIPLPDGAVNVEVINHVGQCQPKLALGALHWQLGKAHGGASYTLEFQCKLGKSMNEREPTLGPIAVEFALPNFSYSGLFVRSVTVANSAHRVSPSVHYSTTSGDFHYKLKYPS